MEFRGMFVLVVLGVAVCYGFPNPRDSTVVKTADIIPVGDGSLDAVTKDTTMEISESHVDTIPVTTDKNSILTPRQVSCKYEEATNDLVCQELCLPKGYSFGLCVGYKCSCV